MLKKILLVIAIVSAPFAISASTLRVLLIGDTNDRSIGKSVVTDLVNFEAFVREAATKAGMEINIRIIKGAEVKSKIIKDAVSKIASESDDAVIFYYSGHGFRTQQVTTRWPLLYIPDAGTTGVDFQWVIDTLNAKNPRMILAISDSCNSFIDNGRSMNMKAMRAEQDAAWRKLFAEFSGRIYASGSQIGQYSFGQDESGGAFTSRFLGIVRGEVTETEANWDRIMKQATKPIPINNPQQKSQDPQYELVKGAGAAQNPQATVEPVAPVNSPPATAETATDPEDKEENEACASLTEFQTALQTVKDSMPAKFNFKKQATEVANYQQLVTALMQAGGDKQMVTLAKNMEQGLKRKNWGRFRSAVWAYEAYILKLKGEACEAN